VSEDMKRIAIIYPWSDPSGMVRGSALRVGLLAKYLKGRYEEVRLLSIDSSCRSFDGVEGLCYWPTPRARKRSALLSLPYRLWLLAVSLGRSRGRTFHLQQYKRFSHDPEFAGLLRETVRWADIVLVEYTFFAARVIREARKLGKKVIVTDHDVIAHDPENAQSGGFMRRAVLKRELQALRGADCAVSVCEEDRKAFLDYGAPTVCIPHGIEIRRAAAELTAAGSRTILHDKFHIEIPTRPVCLFVGSNIRPNVEAARSIEAIAESPQEAWVATAKLGRPFFMVAGRCMEKRQGPNLASLGYIDGEVLDLAYSIAEIVVIPLVEGTGSSLKTIEAMSRGKPVVGTSVAFRGYPVQDGVHCIVEGSLSDYPAAIARLLADAEARERLGKAAMDFADEYDYRTVYKAYGDLIDGLGASP